MSSRFYHLCVDCRDPRALGQFWAAVLEQPILLADDEEVIVGQGADVSWVVLADPEGNEFCVLSPHATLTEQ